MKKLIFIAVCLATIVGASAATIYWEGWCGYTTYAPSVEFFETKEDAQKYYNELNEIYCGSRGSHYYIDGKMQFALAPDENQ